jgi:hypothetical protein
MLKQFSPNRIALQTPCSGDCDRDPARLQEAPEPSAPLATGARTAHKTNPFLDKSIPVAGSN